jgi:phage-related tail fiber protein
MVHGNQWATSTEISVATRILQSIINIWLQGRDGQNNICFTKEEYINSSLSRNVDLLLHQNHFKLFIKNSMEQNGYQFHSTRIAKDLNILYDFFLANKHTFSLQLNSQREITPVK